MVKVAFFTGCDSKVHWLIKLFTWSVYSHCEIIIDGVGYKPKRGFIGMYSRDPKEYESPEWELITVDWDKEKARQYVLHNWFCGYATMTILAFVLPFRINATKQQCSQFVANIGINCGDPRFIGKPTWAMAPKHIMQLLKEGRHNG